MSEIGSEFAKRMEKEEIEMLEARWVGCSILDMFDNSLDYVRQC